MHYKLQPEAALILFDLPIDYLGQILDIRLLGSHQLI